MVAESVTVFSVANTRLVGMLPLLTPMSKGMFLVPAGSLLMSTSL